RGELDTERGADRAVVHRAARQHDGAGLLGHGGGRAGDRPALAVVDHRVWLARRLPRHRRGHARRAPSPRLAGCSRGPRGGGVAADQIGRATSATISYACTAVGTLCLLGLEVGPHAAALYAYAFFFGLGFGARGPIITAMASQLFPGRRFGAIYGMLSVGNGIGGGIAPWFGGAVHDLTGSYRIAFLIAVGFCVLGALCFGLARPRRRSLC